MSYPPEEPPAKHTTFSALSEATYLSGHLLIATPGMQDPRFQKAVIYVCAHSEQGAMGLIINKVFHQLPYAELMSQLSLPVPSPEPQQTVCVHFGGPVETERGFVLHTSDYEEDSTLFVGDGIGLTATSNILKSIGAQKGPERTILALGYAGWSPGQLDTELQDNGWLTVSADLNLLFDEDVESKWDRAVSKLGVDPRLLSSDMGHA